MNSKVLVCGLDVYEARDRRSKGRVVEVIGINVKRNKIIVQDTKTYRVTYVSPARFRSTSNGYRLVSRGSGITLYSSEGVLSAALSAVPASSGVQL